MKATPQRPANGEQAPVSALVNGSAREADRTSVEAGILSQVPVGQLRTAEWNARKTFDPVTLAELRQSIVEHGIQQPLLVRPVPESSWKSVTDALDHGEERYEIVCGHRRFAAAQALGLATVPCILRHLDDAQARQVGLVDNLQREDVPALEEADAYAELQQTVGTAAAIAQRVGKSVGYVTKRLQLVKLCAEARRTLAERLMTIDHALLLARLGNEEQLVNLKWLLNPNAGVKEKLETVIAYRLKERNRDDRFGSWEPQSVLSLQGHIEEHVGRKLSRAPWNLDATNLTEDGRACTGCPSNTRDNAALFGDLAIDEATCENGRCFEEKRKAFVHIQICAAPPVDAKTPALKLSWKDSASKPRALDQSNAGYLSQTFRHGQWVEAKKGSCGFAHTGVTVDWSDDNRYGFGPSSAKLRKPGEQLLVCVAAGCKVHPKSWEEAQRSRSGAPVSQAADEERRRKAKEAAIAETKIRLAAATAAVDGVTKLPEAALRAILRAIAPRHAAKQALLPGISKLIEAKPLTDPLFARAVAVLSIDDLECWANDYNGDNPKRTRGAFIASLKLLGYDAGKHWQRPAAMKKSTTKAAKKPAKKAARR